MGTGQELQTGSAGVDGLSFAGRGVEEMEEGQQLHRCSLKRNPLGDVPGKCHHHVLASEAEPLEGLGSPEHSTDLWF